jgi:hypothetical protein
VTRSLKLTVVALALIGLACGKKPAPKSVAGLPAEAFAPLTETDIARFTRVLPEVASYLRERGGPEVRPHTRDEMGTYLANNIEWVAHVEGVDSVLAANGTRWQFFRAMLYRISACAWVVGLNDETRAQMKRAIRSEPTGAMAAQLRRRMKEAEAIAAAVPPSNVETFKRHYSDLKDFFYIVEADEE